MTIYGLAKLGLLAVFLGGFGYAGLEKILAGRLSGFGKLAAAAGLGALVVFVDSHLIEPNWIKVEQVRIQDPALARTAGQLRIVHLTDIHLNRGKLGFREKDLIRKVNALSPDLIFFTGDLIDDLTQVKPAIELFRSFKARLGIYGVPGDTDHIVMDSASLSRELAPAGIRWLLNEAVEFSVPGRGTFWIAGVDPLPWGPDPFERALSRVPPGAPCILLGPTPEDIDRVTPWKVPVYLTGDTHGGQIGIDFLIRISSYANRTPYMKGLFRVGETAMYVNRGIGTKALPVRFLCRPEIAVIHFVDQEPHGN